MNAKLMQAIDKTLESRTEIPVSVLRPRAEDYDELNATGLVRAAEKQHYGPDRPTDSYISGYGAMTERVTLRDAIDRAGRRR